jgi:hypothetical protein
MRIVFGGETSLLNWGIRWTWEENIDIDFERVESEDVIGL